MKSDYIARNVEEQAQLYWNSQEKIHTAESLESEKFYCLSMLPYPSGELHVGHVRNYTIGDTISRYQRALGKNVFQPMGWDAFGLPAENAAIKHGISPWNWISKNIKNMKKTFSLLGFSFNWDREVTTCLPEYYHWEQWLFTQLFKDGQAYQKESTVNWDPVDNTVLANEQVVNGCGWRSGAPIVRKQIKQWFLKITDYAQELLDSLDQLTGWPEPVITMQRNWIGRSTGTRVKFTVQKCKTPLEIFTTRIDTIYGVSFIAIATDHPLAKQAAADDKYIAEQINAMAQTATNEAVLSTVEPKGCKTSLVAIHPFTRKHIPIWIVNYVLSDYGSGAVMAVPAHDARDHQLARTYDIPILPVIKPRTKEWDYEESAYTEQGILINSKTFNDLNSQQATKAITTLLEKKNKGKTEINYRLRDWGISRQRYWGTPIPIIHCKSCGPVAVPEKDLPVILPDNLIPDGSSNPLDSYPEFYKTKCPQCNKSAKRETDTMDTFVESSWYFARYCCSNQNKTMLDDRAKYWTPVDQYIGGIEHAVLHLLYARYFHKVLRDKGFINCDEPFTKLLTQGMVLKDGQKMSKSKGNTVSPVSLIKEYGADTLRLFILFASPPTQSLEWSDSGVAGCHRFLKKLWQLCSENKEVINEINTTNQTSQFQYTNASETLIQQRAALHHLLLIANKDMERLQFNTVVSTAMKILNLAFEVNVETTDGKHLLHETMHILLRLLSPITPHITYILWQNLGFKDSITKAHWPKPSTQAIAQKIVEWVVQVNGKVRAKLSVHSDCDHESIKKNALSDVNVIKHLKEKSVKKVIVVPNKLINIVAN